LPEFFSRTSGGRNWRVNRPTWVNMETALKMEMVVENFAVV